MATEETTGELEKTTPPGAIEIGRGELLIMLSEIIQKEHEKLLHGRVRNEKTFKLRLDAARCFAYLSSVYGSILRDKDLSEILKRLEVLENASQP